ncbi:hypothetical protein J6524_33660 [Bradyrhizobium sp. WSM 1738]|uniref:hypothetical protein n=1 Tax=Bradyrhizobium hereditatis TaxID=2821405 RepID=UPI001CE337B6|nr:hypothetical protein [Bradyrhizobium hereditatis]MCA6119786.1 hypothetical protein [Bradyrhizobium hereditatis]
MYCRANLSRTIVLVVALLLTAISTGAFARENCASDPQGSRSTFQALRSSYPSGVFHVSQLAAEQEQIQTGATGPDRTNVALIGTITPLLVWRLCKVERI